MGMCKQPSPVRGPDPRNKPTLLRTKPRASKTCLHLARLVGDRTRIQRDLCDSDAMLFSPYLIISETLFPTRGPDTSWTELLRSPGGWLSFSCHIPSAGTQLEEPVNNTPPPNWVWDLLRVMQREK